MKRLYIVGLAIVFVLIVLTPLTAEVKDAGRMTFVAPAESIAEFIKPLFPHRIDFGENFSGAFWIQSVQNIRITNGRIFFSTHIYGKDIEYTTMVKKQKLSVVLGSVDLKNNWNASLRYDKLKKRLLIKPHIEEPANQEDLGQGDILVNALLVALSDVEYPVDLNNLKPIATELDNKLLIIKTDIYDIYPEEDKLVVEIIPTAKVSD
jgi:hypothetical protein